jgi:hypothetical protein
MTLWIDEVDYTEYPEEYNPELIDERLAALLTPQVTATPSGHTVMYHNGVGYII